MTCCKIIIKGQNITCNKCKTPNIRNNKFYCPKYKIFLKRNSRLYSCTYTNETE